MANNQRKFFRTFYPIVMFVAALSLTLMLGCGEDYNTPSGPEEVQESLLLSPDNPQIRAVMAIQDRHTSTLMAKSGVVGTATGLTEDGRPAILVLTETDIIADALAKSAAAPIPESIEDTPVRVLVIGEIRALSHATGRFVRAVPIGVSTGHPNITAGTIACRVKDTDGNVYALSNNHVYADENKASIGDNVLQPGAFDGGKDPDDAIGTLSDFEPIVFKRRAKNEIDAAIALSSKDNLGTATPVGGYGTPNSTIVAAVIGQKVQKFGRTTELTKGEITGVNATVNVHYSSGIAKFVKQIIVESGTRFIGGGDSGSLLVTDNADLNPVGLLFAGNSDGTMAIANRIDLVLDRFGVTVDGEAPPPPTTGSIVGTVTNAGGIAIEGATISLDTGGQSTTVSNGSYTITDVPTGDRSVTASAVGFESQTTTATVNKNMPTTVDFALDEASAPSALSITVTTDKDIYKLKETVHISGRVRVTDEFGDVVADATVTLIIDPPKGPNLTPVDPPVTDASGYYSFDFKTSKRTGNGSYAVTATAEKDGVQSNTLSIDFMVEK